MPQPFIIFTLPRTGSTTLLKLLNIHPSIRCAFEPFNPDNAAPFAQRTQQIAHTYGIPAALRALFAAATGFKHVWRINGWPFAPIDAPPTNTFPGGDLNRQILHAGIPIILLTRRNALRRAISEQISEQMNLWVFQNETDRQRLDAHTFQPLNIARLQAAIQHEPPALETIRAELKTTTTPLQEIAYEDLFNGGGDGGATWHGRPAHDPNAIDPRIQNFQTLLHFLQAEPLTSPPHQNEIHRLLNPHITGFENAHAYHKIPNIKEVEKLSHPTTGFLFD